ncbi:MAG: hypothetical protein Q9167_005421 [Letrouitia subvulpina]
MFKNASHPFGENAPNVQEYQQEVQASRKLRPTPKPADADRLRLVAVVMMQTYHYTLESGCEYACVVTEEAIVYLWVKEDETTTLYYFLAEPTLDLSSTLAEAGADASFPHPQTAISQLLTFVVTASQVTLRDEQWQRDAERRASVWELDVEQVLTETPKKLRDWLNKMEERNKTFHGRRRLPANYRLPYRTRAIKKGPIRKGCKPSSTAQ